MRVAGEPQTQVFHGRQPRITKRRQPANCSFYYFHILRQLAPLMNSRASRELPDYVLLGIWLLTRPYGTYQFHIRNTNIPTPASHVVTRFDLPELQQLDGCWGRSILWLQSAAQIVNPRATPRSYGSQCREAREPITLDNSQDTEMGYVE